MNAKKRVLWVLPKNIFPVNDGAKRANYSLLKSLSLLDVNLDLFIFNEGELDRSFYKNEFNSQNIFLGTRENYRSQWHRICVLLKEFVLSPFTPMSANVFKRSENLRRIENVLTMHQYDVVVFDGLHPYLGFKEKLVQRDVASSKIPTIIYRSHNVESDIWITKAEKTKNLLFKAFLLFQGNLIAKLETSLLEESSKVWVISDEDKDVFKKVVTLDKYKTIPVGMMFNLDKRPTLDSMINLMFLGKLDWDPNREGLKWFLDTIWPNVTNKKLRLTIAGSGDGAWLTRYSHLKNVEFLGLIDNVADLYDKSDFSIVPIQFGSGTRIKVIESIAFGVPVISTLMGVQGSGIREGEYYKAESSADWIQLLNQIESKEFDNFMPLQNRFYLNYSYSGISALIKEDL